MFYTKKSISSSITLVILSAAIVSLIFPMSAFALTPAADLTGEWSGFFQYNFRNNNDGFDCDVTGKVNAEVIQNGNQLDVQFKTTANPYDEECGWEDDNTRIFGNIDGSRITLNVPFFDIEIEFPAFTVCIGSFSLREITETFPSNTSSFVCPFSTVTENFVP